jgi:hypothetical protein
MLVTTKELTNLGLPKRPFFVSLSVQTHDDRYDMKRLFPPPHVCLHGFGLAHARPFLAGSIISSTQ